MTQQMEAHSEDSERLKSADAPIVGSAHWHERFMAALACVSRRLRDRDAAGQLRAAKTGAELYEILALQPSGSPPSR